MPATCRSALTNKLIINVEPLAINRQDIALAMLRVVLSFKAHFLTNFSGRY